MTLGLGHPHLCEHANECPLACPCAPGCYCKTRTCKRLSSARAVRAVTLTARQREVLAFIAERLMDDSSPSYVEIGARFGIWSTNATADHIKALIRKGVLEKSAAAKSRMLRLTSAGWQALGYGCCPTCGARRRPKGRAA